MVGVSGSIGFLGERPCFQNNTKLCSVFACRHAINHQADRGIYDCGTFAKTFGESKATVLVGLRQRSLSFFSFCRLFL